MIKDNIFLECQNESPDRLNMITYFIMFKREQRKSLLHETFHNKLPGFFHDKLPYKP